ncbi:hypothetical protein ARMA_2137 [Ardenticatena maritima]|uniref:Uncharacterized protein n=1 Tax=Ardenticatena maritima TaxID=872965 RepID=A0A0M8K851_9CHLR|nr:hypothetical protein ARMA_2137 [Ardenticatena maritima]
MDNAAQRKNATERGSWDKGVFQLCDKQRMQAETTSRGVSPLHVASAQSWVLFHW